MLEKKKINGMVRLLQAPLKFRSHASRKVSNDRAVPSITTPYHSNTDKCEVTSQFYQDVLFIAMHCIKLTHPNLQHTGHWVFQFLLVTTKSTSCTTMAHSLGSVAIILSV